jgi:glutamyl-tRNA reductase
MAILVFGVNHRTAPIEVREQVALDAEQLPAALAGALETGGTREAVILSTCNRTEFYLSGDDLSEVGEDYPQLRSQAAELIRLIKERLS